MVILAFLQNQWFKDPEKVRALFARRPDLRNDMIRRYLFMGCHTGKQLRKAFGEALCDRIIWEEVSLQIGGHSASKFPADLKHMTEAIVRTQPDIILAFGRIASDAIAELNGGKCPIPCTHIFFAPHPAARNNPMAELVNMAQRVRAELGKVAR